MKDKIELTYETFKRWLGDEEAQERCWKSLCFEALQEAAKVEWPSEDEIEDFGIDVDFRAGALAMYRYLKLRMNKEG